MTETGRRRVLAALAGVATTTLAGCSALDGGSETGASPGVDTAGSPDDQSRNTQDWPMAGRTPRNRLFVADGATASGSLDTTWTYGYDVAEDTEWAVLKHSGPVVVDGVAYTMVTGTYQPATTAEDAEQSFVNAIVGVDAATGEQVATFPLDDAVDSWFGTTGFPIADGDAVYLAALGLFAFDRATGERLWHVPELTAAGQPTLADGTVFLHTVPDGNTAPLVALDAADGTERWRADLSRPGLLPPAVTDDAVLAQDGPDVVAVDRSDGSERWRTNAGLDSVVSGRADATPVSSPAVGEEAVFVAGGVETVNANDAGALVALDRETGDRRWTFRPETGADRHALAGGLPALHDGTVFVTGATVDRSTGNSDAALYAVNAADGSLEWSASTPGTTMHVVGSGDAVIVVGGGSVAVHDVADGTVRARLDGGDHTPSPYLVKAVSGGRVFVSTQQGVAAYEFG